MNGFLRGPVSQFSKIILNSSVFRSGDDGVKFGVELKFDPLSMPRVPHRSREGSCRQAQVQNACEVIPMEPARSVSAVHLPIIGAFSQPQYGASKWASLRTLTRHCSYSTITGLLRFAGDDLLRRSEHRPQGRSTTQGQF